LEVEKEALPLQARLKREVPQGVFKLKRRGKMKKTKSLKESF